MILEVIGAIAVCIWAYLIYQTLVAIKEGVQYIGENFEDEEPDDDTPEDAEPPQERPAPLRAVSGG